MSQTSTPVAPVFYQPPEPPAAKQARGLHGGHGEIEHKLMQGMGYAGLAAGAVALSPIITHGVAMQGGLAKAMANSAIVSCGSSIPSGWAAGIAETIKEVPYVGETLAAGGFATIGTSAGLAVGGMLLGNYLDKRTEPGAFPWGRVVRWACLITSALVAAPIVLSGLTMGLTFLGSYFGIEGMLSAASVFGTLGVNGELTGAAMAQGSAAMMAVHALTCALPLGASAFLLGKKSKAEEAPRQMPSLELPPLRQYEGRVMPLPQQLRVAG